MQKRSVLREPERSGACESMCDWLWETMRKTGNNSLNDFDRNHTIRLRKMALSRHIVIPIPEGALCDGRGMPMAILAKFFGSG